MQKLLARKILFLLILLGLSNGILAAKTVVGSGVDSGGRSVSSAQNKLMFQSVSPLVSGMTSSAGGKTLIHDLQFSPIVVTVNGFTKPLVKKIVTLNATAQGLILKKVEFKVEKLDGTPFSHSNITDITASDGWKAFWDSVTDASDEVTVNVFARAYDGLSWGPWLQINTATIVDNHAPTLADLGLSNPAFSPNGPTSIGTKDTTQFSFQVSERFFNYWILNVTPVSGSTGSKTFTGTNKGAISQVWNGTDTASAASPEGIYNYDFVAYDAINNTSHVSGQLTLDNTAPTFLSAAMGAVGKALNSQQGNISATWNATDNLDLLPDYSVSLAESVPVPKSISGLDLWYDAMDSDTFYTVGTKTTWEDKSGNKRHSIQTASSKSPSRILSPKGVPYIVFDGTDDYLAIKDFYYPANTDINELTVFVVAKSAYNNAQEILSFGQSVLWSVGFIGSAGNEGKLAFTTKHDTIIDPKQLYGSTVYSDNKPHQVTGWWKKTDANSKQIQADSGVLTQTAAQNGKAVKDTSSRYGMIGVGSAATSFDGTKAGAYLNGSVAEILVYNRALTNTERLQIQNYLHTKWQTNSDVLTWSTQVANQTTKTWQKTNVNDTTYFAYKVNAVDDAGNQATTISTTVMTPDRTAPKINVAFTALNGTEDIDFTVTPSAMVSDNWNVSYQLGFTPRIIIHTEGSDYSDSVIYSIRGVGDYKEGIEVKLIPDANTGSSAGGNRYGKENAFVWVTLADRAGNFVEKKIQTVIAPVNDAPRFLTEIGGPSASDPTYYLLHPDTGKVVYSEKFNEDEASLPIYLDHYIDDVDHNLSDLSWVVTGSMIYADGIGTGIFRKGDFTYQIGNAVTNHRLTVTPGANWWGDAKSVVGVTDPLGGISTRNFIARVWPVNDKPLISASIPKVVTVNEDTVMQLNLASYENDVRLEDAIPTYNVNLKWTVNSGYTAGIIKTIDGQSSDIDILTFTPTENAYGTVNAVLRLTDSDQLPAITYPIGSPGGGYTPNPLSTTVSVTLVWKPVNDAPKIMASDGSTLSSYSKDEDASAWELNLGNYRKDVEDAASTLRWSYTPDRTDLLTFNYSSVTDKLTFTPKPNAWGTTNILISVTDNDTGIAFVPYTPKPLTTTKNIKVVLKSINDIPVISSVGLRGSQSTREDKVMTHDKITATVTGYSDIGYSSDTRNSSMVGDEYASAILGQNVKHYLYKWYSDGVALTSSFQESASPTSSITIDPTFEGKTLTLEVAPYDGLASGSLLSKSIKVNRLPAVVGVLTASPNADSYFITGNVTASWGSVTDADTDDSANIGYRAKAWKVEKLAGAPSDMGLDASSYFDSDWQLGKRTFTPEDMHKLFEHGTYYWKVWTGNQFSSSAWDYKDTSFVNNFNVDLIAPEIDDFDNIIQVKNIGSGAIIEDAGLTRVLFGTKPVDNIHDGDDEGYLYQIRLGWVNTAKNEFGTMVTTTGDIIMVDFTDASEWSYTITYPKGTTTYNVYVQDIAGNIGTFKQRHIAGTKPDGKPEGYTYSMVLDWHNEKVVSGNRVYTSGADTIIASTASSNWSYAINYVEGTTTYNVIRRDTLGDTLTETFTLKDISKPSSIYQFSIIDDLTPPAPFKINSIQYTYFEDVASKNYYQIRGKKEKDAGLFFKGKNTEGGELEKSQIVGFTKSEDFVATIYSSKPSGNLTIEDRNGNVQSLSTTVNIRFLVGAPTLKVVTVNPVVINSIANKALLPSTVDSKIFAAKISWVSSRNVRSATLKTLSGTTVAAMTWVTANRVAQMVVSGNNTALSQGANKLTLTISDEAKNTQQSSITINVLKEAPSTAIILANSELVKVGGVWRVKLFGQSKSFVTVKINGTAVTNLNNGTWVYEKSTFDPQTTNVVLQVTDDAYNSATKKLWDKSYYSRYSTQTSIELPIAELNLSLTALSDIILGYDTLPNPLVSLESETLRENSLALSAAESTKQQAFAGKTAQPNLSLMAAETKKVYAVFGRDEHNAVITNGDLTGSGVKIGIPFTSNLLTEPDNLKIMRFNAEKGVWEEAGENTVLDMRNSRITTTIPQLGLYTLAEESPFGTTLKEIRVYPNPWVPNDGQDDNGTLETGIVFDHLTEHSEIKIYTVSGEKVMEEQVSGASYQWKGVNQSGKPVTSGIYLYFISDGKTTKTGKITVIR